MFSEGYMRPETRFRVANGLMMIGLLPYIAVFGYMVMMSRSTGDAAMAAVFTTILGIAVAYVIALVIAFPASLWSRSLTKSFALDTKCSTWLRRASVCGVFPVLAIFPALALTVLR
jgi:hypothetical protein